MTSRSGTAPHRPSKPGAAAGTRTPSILTAIGIAILAAAAAPLSVLANGIVRDSLGAISSGRGGANLAHEDNLNLINDNPAGLAWMEGSLRTEFDSAFLWRDVHYRDADSGDDAKGELFYLPQFSIAGKPVKDLPLTLGLAAYLPGGYGAEYRLDHGIFGRQKYESEGMLLKVLPTAAFRFGKYVSIGGGLGFGYSTARFEVPYTFQTGAFAGQSAKVDLDTDAFGITGNFGIQVRPTDRLTIGASYISETLTEQDGDFKLDLSGGPLAGLFPDPSASYDAEFNLRWPRSAGLGVSYRFDDARLSVDGVWFNWQDAFDRFTLRLSDGDNAGINAFVGSDEAKDVFPLGWRDSYSVRVGYELRLLEDTTLRLGYVYNLNPIPKRTLTPLLPGTLEHSFSIGLGKRLGAFEVHVAYQYAFAREQHIEQSDLVGGDFDDSELDAQAHWGFVTLGARF